MNLNLKEGQKVYISGYLACGLPFRDKLVTLSADTTDYTLEFNLIPYPLLLQVEDATMNDNYSYAITEVSKAKMFGRKKLVWESPLKDESNLSTALSQNFIKHCFENSRKEFMNRMIAQAEEEKNGKVVKDKISFDTCYQGEQLRNFVLQYCVIPEIMVNIVQFAMEFFQSNHAHQVRIDTHGPLDHITPQHHTFNWLQPVVSSCISLGLEQMFDVNEDTTIKLMPSGPMFNVNKCRDQILEKYSNKIRECNGMFSIKDALNFAEGRCYELISPTKSHNDEREE